MLSTHLEPDNCDTQWPASHIEIQPFYPTDDKVLEISSKQFGMLVERGFRLADKVAQLENEIASLQEGQDLSSNRLEEMNKKSALLQKKINKFERKTCLFKKESEDKEKELSVLRERIELLKLSNQDSLEKAAQLGEAEKVLIAANTSLMMNMESLTGKFEDLSKAYDELIAKHSVTLKKLETSSQTIHKCQETIARLKIQLLDEQFNKGIEEHVLQWDSELSGVFYLCAGVATVAVASTPFTFGISAAVGGVLLLAPIRAYVLTKSKAIEYMRLHYEIYKAESPNLETLTIKDVWDYLEAEYPRHGEMYKEETWKNLEGKKDNLLRLKQVHAATLIETKGF